MTFNQVTGRLPTRVRQLQIILERTIDEDDNVTQQDNIRYRVVLVDDDNVEVRDPQDVGSLIPRLTATERQQIQAWFETWWVKAQALIE